MKGGYTGLFPQETSNRNYKRFVYMCTNATNTNFSGISLSIYLFVVYLFMSLSQKVASNNKMTCEKRINFWNETIMYILR